ncbi:NAD-dependent epimerase/dehydratase family protein [Butyrivibrio sp. WCE2006]|uniref:NAD-dependent epimerase/dehydratase family protein n=1 Tax=Butyrivibrio sp. WCE2006 TaxID=1410611 RepID=UPI0005D16840|nr:NAD-dependent epimerase/dehydratase family protein [Butyrivibrio sp. WCE2006]
MNLLENSLYKEDIEYILGKELPWEKIKGKSFLISGATGLIGSCLIDALTCFEEREKSGIKIYAIGRSKEKIANRFNPDIVTAIEQDVNKPFMDEIKSVKADYVLHLASNTHPMQYSTDPIGTIMTNLIGLNNMLEISTDAERFMFASSVEIYGENRGDVDRFDESYLGYIDCNTVRAGYPEGKRAGESLCQSYIKQKGMDIVIPRLSRTYGPTMLWSDTKAISQFIKKGVDGEDIVLKSEGTQLFSYSYVADAVTGLLYVLLLGENGGAYNIADEASDIALKDLAAIIADYAGKKVIFELPDATEAAGYSKATKAILDSAKLKALGWSAGYDMKKGLERTIDILKAN